MYKAGLVFLLSAFGFFSPPSSTYLKLYLNRMSWDPYIDRLTKEGGVSPIRLAAICGKDGSIWAKTPAFNITTEEIKALCGDSSKFAQSGPFIGGYKCRMLRDNKNTEGIYSIDFKTSADQDGNTYSINVGYTITGLIVSVGDKDASGGAVASRAYPTLEYLRKANV